MPILRALLVCLVTLSPVTASAETYLLMAEEEGCMWCDRWNEEISHIYPKTVEGKTAPLRRYDLHGTAPVNVEFGGRIHFTPTFILVQDGAEVGRIEGYPGEDFFWGLLTMMFERAEIFLKKTG